MTSSGLELRYEQQFKKEPKKILDPQINEPKDQEDPIGFTLDDW